MFAFLIIDYMLVGKERGGNITANRPVRLSGTEK